MCACVCVRTYAYMRALARMGCVLSRAWASVGVTVCVRMFALTDMHGYGCVCAWVCVCVCACVYVRAGVRAHGRACVRAHGVRQK